MNSHESREYWDRNDLEEDGIAFVKFTPKEKGGLERMLSLADVHLLQPSTGNPYSVGWVYLETDRRNPIFGKVELVPAQDTAGPHTVTRDYFSQNCYNAVIVTLLGAERAFAISDVIIARATGDDSGFVVLTNGTRIKGLVRYEFQAQPPVEGGITLPFQGDVREGRLRNLPKPEPEPPSAAAEPLPLPLGDSNDIAERLAAGPNGPVKVQPATLEGKAALERLDTAVSVVRQAIQHQPSVPAGFASQVLDTVALRGDKYGPPGENHQLTADLWNAWLSRRLGVPMTMSPEDVCMLNILQKAARLAWVTKDDSWLDIAGYAENVALLSKTQRNSDKR